MRFLEGRVRSGDLVLTIGAGDVFRVGELLVAALDGRAALTGMTAPRPARGRRAALSVVLAATIVAIPVALYLWGRTSDTFAVRRRS